MKDLHENMKQHLALSPVALGATGTSTGKIIDRKGYGGVEFLVGYGAVTTTGSVVTALVMEGDVTGTLTSVADADLVGTETLASLAAGARVSGIGQQVVKRIGYKGSKRYCQLRLVNSGTTSTGLFWADAVLFNPHVAPISNP